MNLEKREFQNLSLWVSQPRNLTSLSMIYGSMFGGLIVMTEILSTIAGLIFIPYIILVIGFFWLIKKTEMSYFHRFLAGLASFMLATLIIYFYIILVANPLVLFKMPFSAHLWRMGLMLGIGIIVNGLMAYLQSRFEVKLS
ncbi:MAG TPA: hypothetical protein VF571_21085 [Pyrinomonadaceae bacterium]|jgi:hypothetical protein